MRRARTLAELILLLYRAMLLAIWVVAVLGVLVSIIEIGGGREGWWLDDGVILAVAGLASIGFFVRARSNWRRALARPIPDHGLKAWLWRQPGWRLALIIWAFQLTAAGLVVAGLAALTDSRGLAAFTQSRAPQFLAVSLALVVIGMAFTAAGQAAAWCVIRQRQTQGSSAAPS